MGCAWSQGGKMCDNAVFGRLFLEVCLLLPRAQRRKVVPVSDHRNFQIRSNSTGTVNRLLTRRKREPHIEENIHVSFVATIRSRTDCGDDMFRALNSQLLFSMLRTHMFGCMFWRPLCNHMTRPHCYRMP